MPYSYTEDQLVEQPVIGFFTEVGRATVLAFEGTFGTADTLLCETKGEVVLVSRLRAALERLNPVLPPEAVTADVDELPRDFPQPRLRSAQATTNRNHEYASSTRR